MNGTSGLFQFDNVCVTEAKKLEDDSCSGSFLISPRAFTQLKAAALTSSVFVCLSVTPPVQAATRIENVEYSQVALLKCRVCVAFIT